MARPSRGIPLFAPKPSENNRPRCAAAERIADRPKPVSRCSRCRLPGNGQNGIPLQNLAAAEASARNRVGLEHFFFSNEEYGGGVHPTVWRETAGRIQI